jgi:hypothetical protein
LVHECEEEFEEDFGEIHAQKVRVRVRLRLSVGV